MKSSSTRKKKKKKKAKQQQQRCQAFLDALMRREDAESAKHLATYEFMLREAGKEANPAQATKWLRETVRAHRRDSARNSAIVRRAHAKTYCNVRCRGTILHGARMVDGSFFGQAQNDFVRRIRKQGALSFCRATANDQIHGG